MDLSNIRPEMNVVGSDGRHVGTVDGVEHNRIKLNRKDPAAGGQHHWLPQNVIDRVEGDEVRLSVTAAEAWAAWQGEGARQGQAGGMGDAATGTGGQSVAHQGGDTPSRGKDPGPQR